ncbi:hypothetical protein LMIY3S_01687 [Labrys miyagiensis]
MRANVTAKDPMALHHWFRRQKHQSEVRGGQVGQCSHKSRSQSELDRSVFRREGLIGKPFEMDSIGRVSGCIFPRRPTPKESAAKDDGEQNRRCYSHDAQGPKSGKCPERKRRWRMRCRGHFSRRRPELAQCGDARRQAMIAGHSVSDEGRSSGIKLLIDISVQNLPGHGVWETLGYRLFIWHGVCLSQWGECCRP